MDSLLPNDINSDTIVSPLVGSCHCGAISYQVSPPPDIDPGNPDIAQEYRDTLVSPSKQKCPTRGSRQNKNKWGVCHCHCEACRRTTGALMVDWVTIPNTDIIITRNGPTGRYRASDLASREFCQKCGTSLFFDYHEEPETIAVNVASFTTPNLFDFVEFTDHIWLDDAAGLVLDEQGKGGGLAGIMNDGLPRTKKNRDSDPW